MIHTTPRRMLGQPTAPAHRASATRVSRDASPAEYLAHCRLAILDGRDPVPPHTIGQIEAMIEHYSERGRRYIPRPEHLAWLGLPAHWGQPVEPLDDLMQERILVTLAQDDTFARAVVAAIRRYL